MPISITKASARQSVLIVTPTTCLMGHVKAATQASSSITACVQKVKPANKAALGTTYSETAWNVPLGLI